MGKAGPVHQLMVQTTRATRGTGIASSNMTAGRGFASCLGGVAGGPVSLGERGCTREKCSADLRLLKPCLLVLLLCCWPVLMSPRPWMQARLRRSALQRLPRAKSGCVKHDGGGCAQEPAAAPEPEAPEMQASEVRSPR